MKIINKMFSKNSSTPKIIHQKINKKFVLFCAGEDSGDNLGAQAVSAIHLWGVETIGIGGPRMQKEGLRQLANFDDFAISGFKDVLTHYFQLRSFLQLLKKILESPNCIAIVLIDYPGLNIKLVQHSKKYSIPILYIAPPQIWAWNFRRANYLHNVTLGVLYDFERKAYKKFDCPSLKIEHPFLKGAISVMNETQTKENVFLFLPGSRRYQLHRNMPLYIRIAKELKKKYPDVQIKFVASRDSLFKEIKKWNIDFGIIVAPENCDERAALFSKAEGVVTTPGSGILEATLVGTKALACSRIDPLTYALGFVLARTQVFTLPNLLLSKKIVPEFLSPVSCFYKREVATIIKKIDELKKEDFNSSVKALQKACEGESIKCLTLEFLMNVLNGDSK